jgi:hypothetical protein
MEVTKAHAQDAYESKLDFPYDLNTLFNLNYSFDTLKKSIEYLARQQMLMNERMANMEKNSK